jgi:hypothetical protein
VAIPQLVLPLATTGSYTISITYNDATVDALTLDLAGEAAVVYHDNTDLDGRDALTTVAGLIETGATYKGWVGERVTGPPYGKCRLALYNATNWVTALTLSADLAALLGFSTTTPGLSVSLSGSDYYSRTTAAWTPPGLWTPLSPLPTVVDRDEAVSEDILLDGRSPVGSGVVQRWSPGGITRRLITLDPLYAASVLSCYAADAGYARGAVDDPNITWEHLRQRWAADPDLIARWHPDREASAYAEIAIDPRWGAQTRAALEEVSLAPLLYRWRIEALQTGTGS